MAVVAGLAKGPRIVAAGPVLSQTFGHGEEHYFPLEMAKKEANTNLVLAVLFVMASTNV